MKQKTVMVDQPVWEWLKSNRGSKSISGKIEELIKEHKKHNPGEIKKRLEELEIEIEKKEIELKNAISREEEKTRGNYERKS